MTSRNEAIEKAALREWAERIVRAAIHDVITCPMPGEVRMEDVQASDVERILEAAGPPPSLPSEVGSDAAAYERGRRDGLAEAAAACDRLAESVRYLADAGDEDEAEAREMSAEWLASTAGDIRTLAGAQPPPSADVAGHADGSVQRADVVYTRGFAAGRAEVVATIVRELRERAASMNAQCVVARAGRASAARARDARREPEAS
jgi:hypothetical protein